MNASTFEQEFERVTTELYCPCCDTKPAEIQKSNEIEYPCSPDALYCAYCGFCLYANGDWAPELYQQGI